jgi:predicted peroxiredoxin
MKLGILVNTGRHLDHIVGVTKAAVSGGHEVIIFVMDEGTKLLNDKNFCALGELQGVRMGYCRQNARQSGVTAEGISGEITEGSQYNNALMHHEADRVIVL